MQVRNLVCALALALSMSGASAAGSVTSADLAEIRQVIERQIDAFRRDDAQGAFALVSPGVRDSFGTAERFLEAIDRAGGLWIAYFSMQRQADGRWRMNGCHLVQPARTISA